MIPNQYLSIRSSIYKRVTKKNKVYDQCFLTVFIDIFAQKNCLKLILNRNHSYEMGLESP